MINGILNIYKEKGYTSHDVVAKMRGILHIKKIGHTGTLDPDAEGVLPVCIGKATKVADLIVDKDKTYEAVLKLGIVTDTQDMTGNVIRTSDTDTAPVTVESIAEAAKSFIGGYNQVPPMYSAIKMDGKRLYELARQGREVERAARWVDIYDIQILEFNAGENEARLRIDCGKGTYIRTLLHDIGEKLGCGGTMKSLVRIRVGSFDIKDSIKLDRVEELAAANSVEDHVVRIDELFSAYPKVAVSGKHDRKVYNGNTFMIDHITDPEEFRRAAYMHTIGSAGRADMVSGRDCGGSAKNVPDKRHYKGMEVSIPDERHNNDGEENIRVRVYDSRGNFVGIYDYMIKDKVFRARKMFL